MDGFSYHSLGELLLGVVLCLLAFGWSAIFWYAATTLKDLNNSVDGLHLSVSKLFDRFDNHAEDLKGLKSRLDKLEK